MPTIILLRHGETHFNREGRIQGHVDSPLTLNGIEQARAYGRTIGSLIGEAAGWKMVSSPLGRCLQTSAIICEALGVPYSSLTTDDRLREVDTGDWAGHPKSALPPGLRDAKGCDAWYFNAPGGEDCPSMAERLTRWLDELGDQDRVIAISHGIAGKVLRGILTGNLEAALAGDAPQNAIFVVKNRTIERIVCT